MDPAEPGTYGSGAVTLVWSWTGGGIHKATELVGLQGEEFCEKQARLQELMNTAELQQQGMEPAGEASSSRRDHGPPAAG
jgi:hypothetical protein